MVKAVLTLILLSMAGAAVARPLGVPDDLASMRREVVHPVGAAELFLLDRCHGHWQGDHFSAPTLGHLFDGVTEQACN